MQTAGWFVAALALAGCAAPEPSSRANPLPPLEAMSPSVVDWSDGLSLEEFLASLDRHPRLEGAMERAVTARARRDAILLAANRPELALDGESIEGGPTRGEVLVSQRVEMGEPRRRQVEEAEASLARVIEETEEVRRELRLEAVKAWWAAVAAEERRRLTGRDDTGAARRAMEGFLPEPAPPDWTLAGGFPPGRPEPPPATHAEERVWRAILHETAARARLERALENPRLGVGFGYQAELHSVHGIEVDLDGVRHSLSAWLEISLPLPARRDSAVRAAELVQARALDALNARRHLLREEVAALERRFQESSLRLDLLEKAPDSDLASRLEAVEERARLEVAKWEMEELTR